MWNTLRTSASRIGASWSYLGELWTVCRSYWSAIFIYSFHSDGIRFAYKLLIWGEGHCAIWSDGICSLTWNSLFLASVVEAWLYCLINWNQWITTLESWCTCLRNTLRTGASRCGAGWSYLSKLWAICCSYWRTILIYSFYSNWIRFTYKLLVWREGHCAIWSNGVSSLTWNLLLLVVIFEGWLHCVIDWN